MRNKTYLVTNPCLLPVAFAQRITAHQLAVLQQHFNLPCPYSTFAVQPYSRKLQQQLKANPNYTKFRYDVNSIIQNLERLTSH